MRYHESTSFRTSKRTYYPYFRIILFNQALIQPSFVFVVQNLSSFYCLLLATIYTVTEGEKGVLYHIMSLRLFAQSNPIKSNLYSF